MSRRLRISSMLTAVVLLVGSLLVALAPGGEREAKATLGPVQAVTLTAADFHPTNETTDFTNWGYYLESAGIQLARIPIPAETVVITNVKIRVYDYAAPGNVCVDLLRARPGDAAEDWVGQVCTGDPSLEDPQTLTLPAFTRVGRFHTAYLQATFAGIKTSGLALYGATVFYRVVS